MIKVKIKLIIAKLNFLIFDNFFIKKISSINVCFKLFIIRKNLVKN